VWCLHSCEYSLRLRGWSVYYYATKVIWTPAIGCPGLDCVGVFDCADFLLPSEEEGTVTRSWRLEERAAARCEDRGLKRLDANDFLLGLALSTLGRDSTAGCQTLAHIAGDRVLTPDAGADVLLPLVVGAGEELAPCRGDASSKGNWTWTRFADIVVDVMVVSGGTVGATWSQAQIDFPVAGCWLSCFDNCSPLYISG